MLAYFLIAGALKDFYTWNLYYSASIYGPREARTLPDFFDHLGGLINGVYRRERWLFFLAIAGLLEFVWQQARRTGHQGGVLLEEAQRHAVFIAALVYFGFCMINIQGPVDLIPLLPFVAIFAALAIHGGATRLIRLCAYRLTESSRSLIRSGTIALITIIVLFQAATALIEPVRHFPTLQDQEAIVAEIVQQLERGDKVFVHGYCEVLVLSGLTNASRYFLLDRGKNTFLDQVEPGGFAGWFDRLKAERPKIIALTRFEDMAHEADFREWAAADCEPRINEVLPYYVRIDH